MGQHWKVRLVQKELTLVVRSKEGLFQIAPKEGNLIVGCKKQFLSQCSDSSFSSCGSFVMGYTSAGDFSLFNFDGEKLLSANFADISNCYFSPANKFVVVTHGAGKETKVTIFRVFNKESITIDIGFMKSGKRYVVFSSRDKVMGVQTAPNLVQVFTVKDQFTAKNKLNIVPSTDIGGLQWSALPLMHANNPNTLKEAKKGTIFEIYNLENSEVNFSHFFENTQQIDVHPSPKSNLLLVRGYKFVDETNQSYYGKNTLTLVDIDKKTTKKIVTYNGPIYNLAWNPKGDSFAVCCGMLPSHTVIYDLTGKPFLVAAKDNKNSVFWSPNGEFLAVAGFGNLNGEIKIWNLPKKQMVGKCQHGDAGDLEWAPDGRHFVTKVEFKFLREGNQYRVAQLNQGL